MDDKLNGNERKARADHFDVLDARLQLFDRGKMSFWQRLRWLLTGRI